MSVVDITLLQRLEPVASLSIEQLEYIAAHSMVETCAPGTCLFRQGDEDRKMLYLLQGDVEISSRHNADKFIISAAHREQGSNLHPIAKDQPRRTTANAITEVQVIRLDHDLVETMMAWDQFMHRDPEIILSAEGFMSIDKSQWAQKMYNSPTFRNLPPANIEQLLDHLEPLRVNAGDVIIRQGDPGDYFYMLNEGTALVTRVVEDENESIELAELSVGSSFGEAALISDKPRNASVSMMTDGVLLRLAKEDFARLLKEPALQWVTYDELQIKVRDGARLLDVRMPPEFAHDHLPGALNIPVQELHRRAKDLNKAQHYVCCCEAGRRSSAAAFILGQYGIQASVLKGGLDGLSDKGRLVKN